jgi:hypothetical protein
MKYGCLAVLTQADVLLYKTGAKKEN